MRVPFKPEQYHTVTPYLAVKGASEAIAFYGEVFGAEELMRIPGPGGMVMHAEVKVGESIFMMTESCEMLHGPEHYGGSPVSLLVYVEDVDGVYAKLMARGCKSVREPADQFYGDRSCTVVDPYGHTWTVATHIEDVDEDELQRRMKAMEGDSE